MTVSPSTVVFGELAGACALAPRGAAIKAPVAKSIPERIALGPIRG
jgi:hypothetical protein